MLVTLGNVKAIFTGYTVKFWEAYTAGGVFLADQLAMKVPSTGLVEQYNFLLAPPGVRQLVDEAVVNDLQATSYSVPNVEWESTLSLKETEIRADKWGLTAPKLQILGAKARSHEDKLLATLFQNGFTTGLDYTGSSFFNAAKSAFVGATPFSNVGTAKLDINGVAFGVAKANLLARVNAQGEPMGLGQDLRLIVSAKNADLAARILTADTLLANNAGANAMAASSNIYKGAAKPVVWPWLDALGMADAWFLMDYAAPLKPFVHQELIPWTVYTVDQPTSEYVLMNHKFLWQIYRSGNMGYGFPEVIYGSDGSA